MTDQKFETPKPTPGVSPTAPSSADLTDALEDTFPASDPPSMTQPKSRPGAPLNKQSTESQAKPTGKPAS